MYLFFDTETTGLPNNWGAPVSDVNNWPRMVQLAYLLYDDKGSKLIEGSHIIKPEGYSIPQEASKIHRITTERAVSEGRNLSEVLSQFSTHLNEAEVLVAHNISFDEKIVGAEFIRKNMINSIPFKTRICTMTSTTNFCAIPGVRGYKWPKLQELHYKLFGEEFEEAHDASTDITATAKCFWRLKELGEI